MPDMWQTVPDSQTNNNTIEPNLRFQVVICPGKFQLDQIQNGRISIYAR